jgi:hypothetical protein
MTVFLSHTCSRNSGEDRRATHILTSPFEHNKIDFLIMKKISNSLKHGKNTGFYAKTLVPFSSLS